MKLAYISGAYRSKDGINGVFENIIRARTVALQYWQKGIPAFCPHMNTAFMDGAAHDSVWLDGDLEMLRRCDIVVMLPNWEQSEGATAEHAEAKRCGLEINYV